MVIIGIDSGLTGAIAFIYEDTTYEVLDLPTMAHGKGNAKVKKQINASALATILKDRDISLITTTAFLERVNAMPGQGVASMFSMGDSFGCIRGVLGYAIVPTEIITPRQWKRHFNLPSDKDVCRAKAIELFPDAPLHRTKDHNRAEALLIAKYGYDLTTNQPKG